MAGTFGNEPFAVEVGRLPPQFFQMAAGASHAGSGINYEANRSHRTGTSLKLYNQGAVGATRECGSG
jgi:hypothetical protein